MTATYNCNCRFFDCVVRKLREQLLSTKVQQTLGIRVLKPIEVKPSEAMFLRVKMRSPGGGRGFFLLSIL